MTRRPLTLGIGACALALLALLAYSLERTAWLFSLFEARYELAIAAAVVVELSAVALLIGGAALASLDEGAQRWANRALGAVLSVQALANLSAGYLRGGARTLGAFEGDGWRWYAGYAVASALWLTTNLAVPALILCLSKLLERLVSARGASVVAVVASEPVEEVPLPAVIPQPTPATPQDALRLEARRLRSEGASWQTIATAVGRSPTTVREWLAVNHNGKEH